MDAHPLNQPQVDAYSPLNLPLSWSYNAAYFPTRVVSINNRINGQRTGKQRLDTVRRLREQMVDFPGVDVAFVAGERRVT